MDGEETQTPSTTTTQSQPNEAAKIMAAIYEVGVLAASIFVKNPAHQQTAANIISLLNTELPTLKSIFGS